MNSDAGPQPGAQPDAIYCPLCKAHLRPWPSHNQGVESAHRYECEHGHMWEINKLRDAARPWNGSRPGWTATPR